MSLIQTRSYVSSDRCLWPDMSDTEMQSLGFWEQENHNAHVVGDIFLPFSYFIESLMHPVDIRHNDIALKHKYGGSQHSKPGSDGATGAGHSVAHSP